MILISRLKILILFAAGALVLTFWIRPSNGASSGGGLRYLPVPAEHPVYAYLERLEVRGFIFFRANVRPLTRGEIISYLNEAADKNSDNPERYRLSRREKEELLRYREEFCLNPDRDYESETSRWSRFRNGTILRNLPFYRDGYNLFTVQGGGFYLALNPVLYWDVLTDSTGEVITRRTSGFHLIAGLHDNLACYFDFRDTQERGRGPYEKGERSKLYSDNAAYVSMDGGDVCYYDITQAVVAVGVGNLLIDFGRGSGRWGAGRSGNLLLSDNPPPFDFLSARYDISSFLRFAYLAGVLHPYPEIYQEIDSTSLGHIRKIVERKYISAHRLEVYPLKGVEIGITESVIYGQRGLEPAYLNPINLYFSAEHNLGDMDNIAWSGDIEVNLIEGVSLYGELFIDDMRTGKLGTNWIGNKFGWLTGLFLVNPFQLNDIDFTCEYARLDPFVYTHIFPINTYKNWNSSLGHFLPPNSDRLFVKAGWRPFYSWSGSVSAAFVRHGENILSSTDTVNVGGDINLPYNQGQESVPFLDGRRMNISIWEAVLKWEPLEYYFMEGRYCWHRWSGGDENEWQIIFGVNFR